MTFLRDKELYDEFKGGNIISSGMPEKDMTYESAESPVQPCSVDLHIGQIYCPRKEEEEGGEDITPLERHVLHPGETVFVTTREELDVPEDVCIIAFPISRISREGILTTDPGHVDPGYSGRIHLTRHCPIHSWRLKKGDGYSGLILCKIGP